MRDQKLSEQELEKWAIGLSPDFIVENGNDSTPQVRIGGRRDECKKKIYKRHRIDTYKERLEYRLVPYSYYVHNTFPISAIPLPLSKSQRIPFFFQPQFWSLYPLFYLISLALNFANTLRDRQPPAGDVVDIHVHMFIVWNKRWYLLEKRLIRRRSLRRDSRLKRWDDENTLEQGHNLVRAC